MVKQNYCDRSITYKILPTTYNSSNMLYYVTPTAAEINSLTETINAEVK